MKKFAFFLLGLVAFVACSEQKAPFNYRGLAFTTPVDQFVDSMLARGFAIDSAASDSGRTAGSFLGQSVAGYPGELYCRQQRQHACHVAAFARRIGERAQCLA